ncbi:hypothetical protein R0J90_18835, partial [Micrococcus sp. SIMBA_144]
VQTRWAVTRVTGKRWGCPRDILPCDRRHCGHSAPLGFVCDPRVPARPSSRAGRRGGQRPPARCTAISYRELPTAPDP